MLAAAKLLIFSKLHGGGKTMIFNAIRAACRYLTRRYGISACGCCEYLLRRSHGKLSSFCMPRPNATTVPEICFGNCENYLSFPGFSGLFGNHPFSTRFRCSKSSFIAQKDVNAKTPHSDETRMFPVSTEPATPAAPASKNTHQQPVPQ